MCLPNERLAIGLRDMPMRMGDVTVQLYNCTMGDVTVQQTDAVNP